MVFILISLLSCTQEKTCPTDMASFEKTALAIGVFHLSERAAKMNSRIFFMQIVMINTMVKMFGSVALVIGYFSITKPSTNKFIVPFLIVYVLYTIFDTYFMMKQSRNIYSK